MATDRFPRVPERTAATVAVLGVHAGRVPAGCEALLAGATLVAGGARQLDDLGAAVPAGAERVTLAGDVGAALDRVAAHRGPACVLASGDPGFFGVLRTLSARVAPARLAVHPAPTSVALAFARLGVPWDDAVVASGHGRAPRAALAVALRHPKVAILTAPAAPPAWYARRLVGTGRELAVAECLGTPRECVVRGSAEELAEMTFAEPNVLVVLDPAAPTASRATVWPPARPGGWALPDDAFAHRSGMVTKAEVRAVALARLGPATGDLVWDVGCGSGSVAVECARLGAAAVGIDHDAGAVDLTRRNAAAHGVPVWAVHGAAPAALDGLPDPDAVFVGGGGDGLGAILDAVLDRDPRVVVVTLALVDRVGPVLDRLGRDGRRAEGTLVQASRLRPLAGGHRLAAVNPVAVLWGERA